MRVSQVKGNTFVLEGEELIPLYLLRDGRCVLLDTGLLEEREELEQTLLDAGLHPAGVLCSHAHVDHCANNGYLQHKYGTRVALTAQEAGMCASALNLKCYFLTLPPEMVARESGCMVHVPDATVPGTDGPFSFCGADFQIVHTPGHSAGHICTITPDGVCYVADALLSQELLGAKLPYDLCHQAAMASREKLRGLDCSHYVIAHRGICPREDFPSLICANQELIVRRAEEIFSLVARPMTASQIGQAACGHYQLLTQKPRRALRFERNVRFFIEYLVDTGRLDMVCREGTVCYRRAEK